MAKPQAFPLVLRISSAPPKLLRHFYPVKPFLLAAGCNSSIGFNQKNLEHFIPSGPRYNVKKPFLKSTVIGIRGFSSSYSHKGDERREKPLPWLTKSVRGDRRKVEDNQKLTQGVKSSWEVSAEKFLKDDKLSVEVAETKNFERRTEFREKEYIGEEEEAAEVVNDPRWDNIRNRFNRIVEDKPEVRKWNKQEDWGRKTWKEAKESTLPRIVGQEVYGVGPVLAALSAGRREFYALYIQEGIDFSSNNRKKKDKKGFEKALKMAEKIRLTVKEVSKHDLNMITDNRPHQGLVLDASPLEMVGIKELEPISIEAEKKTPSLWLALDEVTDPQNLGAIIRSAYFFGASGVVLCAKNSAPLSGVVSKASAGSLELMEVRSCRNMMQFLTSSAENGWRVLGGSVSSKAVSLSDVAPGSPTILVLGSEGTGLRPLVERSCTQLIKIQGNLPVDMVAMEYEDVESVENPGQEFRSFLAVESLNVSVAAGVMINHLIGNSYNDSGDL